MKALQLRTDGSVRSIDIENTLEAFWAAVGGYIETVSLDEHTAVVADKERRLKCKPVNLNASLLAVCRILGDVLVCGVDFDRFTDLSDEQQTALMNTIAERRKLNDMDK